MSANSDPRGMSASRPSLPAVDSETNPPGETDDSWFVMSAYCHPPEDGDLIS